MHYELGYCFSRNENLVPVIVGGTIGVIVVIAVIGVALTFGHRWYKERILVYTEEEMVYNCFFDLNCCKVIDMMV